MLPVTDGVELEGACESLLLLLDRRQAFYRHTGGPGGGAAAAGVEGADLLSVLTEEDWRRGVGFADWVGLGLGAKSFTFPLSRGGGGGGASVIVHIFFWCRVMLVGLIF